MDTLIRDTRSFVADMSVSLQALRKGMAGIGSSWGDPQFADLQRAVASLSADSARVLTEATELEQTLREAASIFGRGV